MMMILMMMGDESECRWRATVTVSREVDAMMIPTMMKLMMTTGA